MVSLHQPTAGGLLLLASVAWLYTYKQHPDTRGYPFGRFLEETSARDTRLDMRLVKTRTGAWHSWSSHPQDKNLSTTTTSQRRVPVLSLSRSSMFGGVGHNEMCARRCCLNSPAKIMPFTLCKPQAGPLDRPQRACCKEGPELQPRSIDDEDD